MIDSGQFITMAEQIAAEEPSYRHGGTGQDGTCDCIGLIIGAIRRAGGNWRGIHGSNYAARSEMAYLRKITGPGELTPGEVVFKAYDPGQGGYTLPARYEKGGDSYNGDLRDYYHIGIVESVQPLRIRHMTSPRPKMDTSIGKWAYYGKLKSINLTGGEVKKMETVIISGGNTSAGINMRATASTGSSIVTVIPQGAEAFLIEGGGYWNYIDFAGKKGYVKSEFVHKADQGEGDITITISAAKAQAILPVLEEIVNQIVDRIGRG